MEAEIKKSYPHIMMQQPIVISNEPWDTVQPHTLIVDDPLNINTATEIKPEVKYKWPKIGNGITKFLREFMKADKAAMWITDSSTPGIMESYIHVCDGRMYLKITMQYYHIFGYNRRDLEMHPKCKAPSYVEKIPALVDAAKNQPHTEHDIPPNNMLGSIRRCACGNYHTVKPKHNTAVKHVTNIGGKPMNDYYLWLLKSVGIETRLCVGEGNDIYIKRHGLAIPFAEGVVMACTSDSIITDRSWLYMNKGNRIAMPKQHAPMVALPRKMNL